MNLIQIIQLLEIEKIIDMDILIKEILKKLNKKIYKTNKVKIKNKNLYNLSMD